MEGLHCASAVEMWAVDYCALGVGRVAEVSDDGANCGLLDLAHFGFGKIAEREGVSDAWIVDGVVEGPCF